MNVVCSLMGKLSEFFCCVEHLEGYIVNELFVLVIS